MYNWNNDIRELEKKQARQNYIKFGASLAFAAIVGAATWQTIAMSDKSQAEKIDRIATELTSGFNPLATAEQKQQAEKAYAQAQEGNLTPILTCISQSRELVHINENGRDYFVKDHVDQAKAVACFNSLSERKPNALLEKATFSTLLGAFGAVFGVLALRNRQHAGVVSAVAKPIPRARIINMD